MRCKPCAEQRGYPYKRGHLVRLRRSKVTTKDDGEPWYPGDQRIAIEGRLQGAVLISPNAVSSHLRLAGSILAACFAQDIFGRA